ncbi:MAG TPA: hypothetical protein VFA26_06300 [Gemmataceae bacterium]|nr:hypothetical protein [Gemmataceae bacterium]
MQPRTVMSGLVTVALLGGALALAALTHDWWYTRLFQRKAEPAGEESAEPAEPETVRLTEQAQKNLRLVVRPARLQSYWRTITVPGQVVERPAHSDHGLAARTAGIVRKINAVPGDLVRPGDPLFAINVAGEALQTLQADHFKTHRDLQLNQEQLDRLQKSAGSVPPAVLIELDQQHRRLEAALKAQDYALTAHGLTPEQVAGIREGKFVTEVVVRAPDHPPGTHATPDGTSLPLGEHRYEIEELKVNLGDHVTVGQMLCHLACHEALYVEGRGFRNEAPLLARAAQQGWPVRADFDRESAGDWPTAEEGLRIRSLSNTFDPQSQTFPFYLPLTNQYREYKDGDRTRRVWRFRPGERVRLSVPVERFDGVIVLPAEALVREGAETYVFRQNGDVFERRPVHVVWEDRRNVVIANDGSIHPGNAVAHNAAGPLNRALKVQAASAGGGEEEGHHHDH